MYFLGRTLSGLFLAESETLALDASYKYLRRIGYFYPMLGTLVISRMSLQGLGYSNRAVLAGVIEMILRSAFVLTFVPKFGFDAITFTDQVAWFGAIAYLVPMFIHSFKEVERNIRIDIEYMEAK